MVYNRETVAHLMTEAEQHEQDELKAKDFKDGFQVEDVDRMAVAGIMTGFVFTVHETMPAAQVVQEMLAMKVHRLFVVDETGVMVGVISAIDVLRHLQP
jgi:predicted transcriptional regulator